MKGDIPGLLLYLVTEFVNYIFVYAVIFQMQISKSRVKWFMCVTVILILHFAVMFAGREPSGNISIFIMVLLPLLLVEHHWYKKLLLYPVVVLGSSAIAVSFSFILSVALKIPETVVIDSVGLTALCQGILSIALILCYVYRKLRKCEAIQIQLGWRQYILFYITVICVFLMLAPLRAIMRECVSVENVNRCGVAISVACIVFIVLVLWQGIAAYTEMQLRERNRINEEYMEMQTNYFHRSMMQDEKMRRFKHDMNGHIKAMMAYCEGKETKELKDYLENIIEESAIYDIESYTKNRGVDAVISDLMRRANDKNIHVDIKGILPEKVKITTYDLCTIFSNLLKNAIEACEKIVTASERAVVMVIESYDNMLYI